MCGPRTADPATTFEAALGGRLFTIFPSLHLSFSRALNVYSISLSLRRASNTTRSGLLGRTWEEDKRKRLFLETTPPPGFFSWRCGIHASNVFWVLIGEGRSGGEWRFAQIDSSHNARHLLLHILCSQSHSVVTFKIALSGNIHACLYLARQTNRVFLGSTRAWAAETTHYCCGAKLVTSVRPQG